MEEKWKDVVGYEGLYQISSFGRVKSLPKMRGAFYQEEKIKNLECSNGYLRCTLHKNKHTKKFFVHVLVATSFIEHINKEQIQVDHINRDRADNRVENLRWCTAKENVLFPETYEVRRQAMIKMNANPLVKDKKKNTTCCKSVIQYDLDGNIINTFISAEAAKRFLGYSVSPMCRGEYKRKYKNRPFVFKYGDRDGLLMSEYARRKNL